MLKYCKKKWDKNKEYLEEALRDNEKLNTCEYRYLVELVVDTILNDEENSYSGRWDSRNITVVNDGDYQGTLLFLIPAKTYQPAEYEYLMTFVSYGSCSGCDALQHIQDWYHDDKKPNKEQLKDYMELCKDLVCNMIKPYNSGWRNESEFETVEEINEDV